MPKTVARIIDKAEEMKWILDGVSMHHHMPNDPLQVAFYVIPTASLAP